MEPSHDIRVRHPGETDVEIAKAEGIVDAPIKEDPQLGLNPAEKNDRLKSELWSLKDLRRLPRLGSKISEFARRLGPKSH
jgi:hypothetical protein